MFWEYKVKTSESGKSFLILPSLSSRLKHWNPHWIRCILIKIDVLVKKKTRKGQFIIQNADFPIVIYRLETYV